MASTENQLNKLTDRLPTQNEIDAAARLRDVLATLSGDAKPEINVSVDAKHTTRVALPPALCELLSELLGYIESGNTVSLAQVPSRLTSRQAAHLLNMSHNCFTDVIDCGQVDFEKIGNHRMVSIEDVLTYKSSQNSKRSKALDELAVFDSRFI